MKKFTAFAILALGTSSLFCIPAYERIEDKNPLKIQTPALAERKTAKIRLSNGLEAFLISDPGVHESAAALSVEAGSWQDPKEYPGTAHFLEHMLFMGTAAYPKESEYMKFINDNGGKPNAYTAPDRTVYSFSISNDHFKGALDRFSHFFIDPIFPPASIARELHAVDQEHAKNIEHDGWRCMMILKETGNPNHPNAAFSTGNAATLSGIPQEALKKWYREHYSSNRMHLVAISPLPLEEMIQLTADKFTAVPNHSLQSPVYPEEMLSAKQKGHFLYVKPVKDLKSISLLWELPKEIAADIETGTPSMIAYALANGTENGLLEQLKREKIAENVSVSTDRWSKDSLLFCIDISLTEAGVKQIDTVITRTFQALNRMKETGIPRYIFDEKHKMAKIGYEYQSRSDAFSFVTQEVADLVYEKLDTFPYKASIPTRYDAKLLRTMLESLTADSCIYFVMADPKLTGVATDIKEKWMDASYAIKKVPTASLVAWADAKPHSHIDIPSANPYLPESLALLLAPENLPVNPVLAAQEDQGKIYFKQDQKYLVPETTALITLKTPQMDGSAKARALFDLYSRALTEKLSTPLFFAQQAGLGVNFFQSDDFDFGITASGYSEKTPLFLGTIFQSFREVSPTAAEFNIYKESLLSSYDNASKELPVRQSVQLLNSLIFNNSPTARAKYQALKAISYEDFLSFATQVFKTAYAEGMIYGNITSAEADNIWGELKTSLNFEPFPLDKHYKKGVLNPSEKLGPYMVVQNTERQGNSVLLMLHEGSFTMEKRAAQEILSNALKDDFFNTLRTKQQTGYIASSWDVEAERQLMQFFAVQSITHQPPELLARFELFIEEFSRHINKKISSERFETLKASLIKELEMPPENLPGKAYELYTLAFEYDDFDWVNKRIAAVKNLSYDDFITTSKTFLSRSNLKRLAVLMEGVLPEQNQFRYEVIQQDNIRNVGPYISYK